jgi:type I restriction enzyme S subunit
MIVSADPSQTTSRYLYEFLRSPAGLHALLANTSQTGVPAIARPTTSLRAIRLVVPPLDALTVFDDLMAPAFGRSAACSAEARILAALRDTLLPKLISGEVRLSAFHHAN